MLVWSSARRGIRIAIWLREERLEGAGELVYMGLEEHVDVLGGNVVNFKATGGERRPAEGGIFALAEDLGAAIGSAHEGDFAGVRLRYIGFKGAAVGLVHEEVAEIEGQRHARELEGFACEVAAIGAEIVSPVLSFDGEFLAQVGQAALAETANESCGLGFRFNDGLMAGDKGVKHDDESRLDALSVELPSHFESDIAAEGSASDEIRASGIEGAHFCNVDRGELLD